MILASELEEIMVRFKPLVVLLKFDVPVGVVIRLAVELGKLVVMSSCVVPMFCIVSVVTEGRVVVGTPVEFTGMLTLLLELVGRSVELITLVPLVVPTDIDSVVVDPVEVVSLAELAAEVADVTLNMSS